MRLVFAVTIVVGFMFLSVYFDLHGRSGLRWLCFAIAVISPWFFGMTMRSKPEDVGD